MVDPLSNRLSMKILLLNPSCRRDIATFFVFLNLLFSLIFSEIALTADMHEHPSNSSHQEKLLSGPESFHHVGHPSSAVVSIVKGSRHTIDVLELCERQDPLCKSSELNIKLHPTEGILFPEKEPGVWAYQHAGTSDIIDLFEVSRTTPNEEIHTLNIEIEVSEFTGQIEIVFPTRDSVVAGSEVKVNYRTTGEGFDHLHLKMEDSEHGHVSLKQRSGIYTFFDVLPGKYVIFATLARSDHRTIPRTEVAIEFSVVDESKE